MNTISGSDNSIRRLSPATVTTRPAVAAVPAETTLPPADSFQTTGASPVAQTAAVQTPSVGRRVLDKLNEWATMLVPTPLAVATSAVSDVINGNVRESHFEHTKEHASEADAKATFEAAQARLLNPNEWKELGPKWMAADFQVVSAETGKPKDGPPKQGDYLSIKLPDPGPPVWVRIEEIKTGEDHARVVVRPSENPTTDSGTIIHLFGEETTNVFELKRDGNKVTGSVSGHNETPNMTGNVFQNMFAGARLAGAWMGAKKPQWNSFTDKLVNGPVKSHGLQMQGHVSGMAAYVGMMQPDGEKK